MRGRTMRYRKIQDPMARMAELMMRERILRLRLARVIRELRQLERRKALATRHSPLATEVKQR